MKNIARVTAVLFTLLLIAACGSSGSSEGIDVTKGSGSGGGDVSKTTLSADKTAIPFHKQVFEYDWTMDKTVDLPLVNGVPGVTIAGGDTADITYIVDFERLEPPILIEEEYGVSGSICVTNGGDWATEGLAITDVVQVNYSDGNGFNDIPSTSTVVDVSAMPVLQPLAQAPNNTYCYPYEIVFEPVGAVYRNVAHVTITNHAGHLPGDHNCPGTALCPFGPDPKADFANPLDVEPTITYIDETADISDHINLCPIGFTCDPINAGPVHVLFDSPAVDFIETIVNSAADCNTYYDLKDTASLVESDTQDQSSDSVTVSIYTGECATGCTLTIGYWKTHAGFGPGRQPDDVSARLPIMLGAGGGKSFQVTSAAQVVKIEEFYGIYGTGTIGSAKEASNGINKLYAQLLAAKLNATNGASLSAISSVITAADNFLKTNNSSNWANLTKTQKNQVLSWMSSLDNYNNGLIGPGHCE
jgi:hypothetical protein